MNKTKNTFEKNNIDSVQETIEKLIKLQNNLAKVHKSLLIILKKYSYKINNENITQKYVLEIKSKITNIFQHIDISIETMSLIRKLLSTSRKMLDSLKKNLIDDNEFENYKTFKKDLFVKISSNYKILKNFIKCNVDLLKKQPVCHQTKKTEQSNISVSSSDSSFIENTLLISESKNKVILPYKLSEIKTYISEHPDENLSVQDVINTMYTLSLDTYKNSVFSRFTESFKLIRQKEHGSIKDALDLAFEMAFNYSLHPAIITACKNINELDIYLACLEYNELQDFRFFNVNFEITPSLSNKKLIG